MYNGKSVNANLNYKQTVAKLSDCTSTARECSSLH